MKEAPPACAGDEATSYSFCSWMQGRSPRRAEMGWRPRRWPLAEAPAMGRGRRSPAQRAGARPSARSCRRLRIRAVQPVWCEAPRPQPVLERVGDRGERPRLPRPGRELHQEVVAVIGVEATQGFHDQVVHRHPHGPAPVGVAAEHVRRRVGRIVADGEGGAALVEDVGRVAVRLRQRAHAPGEQPRAGNIDLVVVELVVLVPEAEPLAAHVGHGLGDEEEVLEELGGGTLVHLVVERELEGDAHHGEGVHRHPGGSVGLMHHAEARGRPRPVEHADVVEAEEPALEHVAAPRVLAVPAPTRRPEAGRWGACTIRASTAAAASWRNPDRAKPAAGSGRRGPRRRTRDIPTCPASTARRRPRNAASGCCARRRAPGAAPAGADRPFIRLGDPLVEGVGLGDASSAPNGSGAGPSGPGGEGQRPPRTARSPTREWRIDRGMTTIHFGRWFYL